MLRLMLCLALTLCGSVLLAEPPVGPPEPPEEEVPRRINQAREKARVAPLREDAKLSRQAAERCRDLVREDDISPLPPRTTEAVRVKIGDWALLRLATSATDVAGTARQVWLESEGARASLLAPEAKRYGCAAGQGASGRWYVVLLVE